MATQHPALRSCRCKASGRCSDNISGLQCVFGERIFSFFTHFSLGFFSPFKKKTQSLKQTPEELKHRALL